jgi:hypothetical protein
MSKQPTIVTVHGFRYDFEAVLSAAKIAITAAISAVEGGSRPNLDGFEKAWRDNKQAADASSDQAVLDLPRLKMVTRLLGQSRLMLSATTGLFISEDGAHDGSIDPMPGILIGTHQEDIRQIGLSLTAEEATAIHKAVTALDLGVKVAIQAMIRGVPSPGTHQTVGHYVAIAFPAKVFASCVPEAFTMVWYGLVAGGTTPGKPPIEA